MAVPAAGRPGLEGYGVQQHDPSGLLGRGMAGDAAPRFYTLARHPAYFLGAGMATPEPDIAYVGAGSAAGSS